ncbi:hypothetical protein TWF718_009729 [Orbilia javanica]|uniref:Phthiocerol/phthiodiolone dimycocerosyl transferase C-terminal domain-containing protein n=1 Tax=Orbilia javanica TaxID=47235 RepID=A0AAN8RF08_9PEZI
MVSRGRQRKVCAASSLSTLPQHSTSMQSADRTFMIYSGDQISQISDRLVQLTEPKRMMSQMVQWSRFPPVIGQSQLASSRTTGFKDARSGGIQNVVPTLPEGLVEHRFTERDSAAILKACRANKITLTTAIWAAQAKAALKHSGGTSGNLATFVPVNLRSQVQTSATSTEINNTINLAFSHLPVENSDFIEWAKGAQNDLSFWRNSKESMGVFQSVCEALEEKVNKDSKTGVTYPARFFLSNVGISDNYITDPVEDVWLNIMVVTPSSGGLVVLTTKGRIRMTACYNRAFFDEGQIESYMEMVVSYLEKGLGLKFSDGDSLRPSIESKERISTSQHQHATTQAFPAPQQ